MDSALEVVQLVSVELLLVFVGGCEDKFGGEGGVGQECPGHVEFDVATKVCFYIREVSSCLGDHFVDLCGVASLL